MPDSASFSTSRRNLVRLLAAGGVVAGIGGTINAVQAEATENNSGFPSDFSYPAVTGPSLALWGSSSIEGARATEGVSAGFDARLNVLLQQYLGVPVLNFGRGAETSTNIAARRGVSKYATQIVFPNETVPASGSATVTLESDTPIAWNEAAYYPGYVQDIPCYLQAADETTKSYVFTRVSDGEARYAPQGTTANYMQSYQDMISRSSYHMIQVGRNNVNELDLIKENTQQCFDLAPKRTIVLGHFRIRGDAKDSARAKNIDAYNAWGAETYGNLFMNPETWIREKTKETWLRYGDLAGSTVWDSKDDETDDSNNQIPRSLYASDGVHLNGWGYLAMARLIQAKVNEMGWFA